MSALALTATPVGVAMFSQDAETLTSSSASNVAKAMAGMSLIGSMTPIGTVDDITRNAGSITTKIEGQAARAYKSFSAFKRAEGTAGSGNQWHHIVEQNPTNITRFGQRALQNIQNVVKLPTEMHRMISSHYSSLHESGVTVL